MKMDEERKEMSLILSVHKLTAFMEQQDAGVDRRRKYGHLLPWVRKKHMADPTPTHPQLSALRLQNNEMGQWEQPMIGKQVFFTFIFEALNFSSWNTDWQTLRPKDNNTIWQKVRKCKENHTVGKAASWHTKIMEVLSLGEIRGRNIQTFETQSDFPVDDTTETTIYR